MYYGPGTALNSLHGPSLEHTQMYSEESTNINSVSQMRKLRCGIRCTKLVNRGAEYKPHNSVSTASALNQSCGKERKRGGVSRDKASYLETSDARCRAGGRHT